MKSKKIIALCICVIFFLIYMCNQQGLFGILMKPQGSDYDIQKTYDTYLVERSQKYIGIPNKIDNDTNTCIIFVNEFISKGVYTSECSKDSVNFKSESTKFNLENTKLDNTVYYDSIYEKIYSIKEIRNIDNFSQEELAGYNTIYVPQTEDITIFFPKNFEYIKIKEIYNIMNEEYMSTITNIQNKVINILSIFVIVYIFYEYIKRKRKEYSVYQLLGISDLKIIKGIMLEYFIFVTISFIIAALLYFIITYLNGKIFYIDLYFEYFSFQITFNIYIKILVCILPLSLLLIYINNFIPLEKRIK